MLPIKKISLFIEGNKDNFHILEVEESTFNSGEVKSIGNNEIDTSTQE